MKTMIRRVAVLGAGRVGVEVAAQFANASVQVLLLDVVPSGDSGCKLLAPVERNRLAIAGLQAVLETQPPLLVHRSHAELVRVGNTEDDLAAAAESDLVIDALEDRHAVRDLLFGNLEPLLQPPCIVASVGARLRAAELVAARGVEFGRRFVVLGFSRPMRRTELLEVAACPETAPEVLDFVCSMATRVLGKVAIVVKDSPYLVAERLGIHAVLVSLERMLAVGLDVRDADRLTGPFLARRIGCFATIEALGLHGFSDSVRRYLDWFPGEQRQFARVLSYIRRLEARSASPSESVLDVASSLDEGGMYRDPITRARPSDAETAEKKLTDVVRGDDASQRFAWQVLALTLLHAARCADEVAHSVADVDRALRAAFGWDRGPFEAWDAGGFAAIIERMLDEGMNVPDPVLRMKELGARSFYRGGDIFDLVRGEYIPGFCNRETSAGLKIGTAAPVLSNDGADVWDIDDGVLALCLKTRLNTIDHDVLTLLDRAITRAEKDFRALIISSPGADFCIGANLMLLATWASRKRWADITSLVRTCQTTAQRLRYSLVPVVAAPFGLTVGGGLELCLSATDVQASAETYAGLVETKIGLVPGGGGTQRLLRRALDGIPEGTDADVVPFLERVFENILCARVSTSMVEARRLGYLPANCGISMSKRRQLAEAKARAIGLADSGHRPPPPAVFRLPGATGVLALERKVERWIADGRLGPHDATIGKHLASILCGGGAAKRTFVEDELLELERESFVSLCGEPKTRERMQHMLSHKRGLRN